MTPTTAIQAVRAARMAIDSTDDDGLYPHAGDALTLRRECAALIEAIDSRSCIPRMHSDRAESDPHYAYTYRGLR